MNLKTGLIAIGIPALVIVVLVTMFLVFSGPTGGEDDSGPKPAPVSEGEVDDGDEPAPTTEAPDDVASDEDKVVQEVAKDFVYAYRSQSYEDETPNTWVAATKEFSTPKFYDSLTKGVDPNDGGTMVSDMERRHMSEFPEFDDTFIQKDDAKTYRVYVQYTLVNESDGGRFVSGDFSIVTVVKDGDEWLVDGKGTSAEDQEGFFDQGHDH